MAACQVILSSYYHQCHTLWFSKYRKIIPIKIAKPYFIDNIFYFIIVIQIILIEENIEMICERFGKFMNKMEHSWNMNVIES